MSRIKYAVSSELMRLECLRTLDRFRIKNRLTEDEYVERIELIFKALKNIELVRLSSQILIRASQSFPTLLGTLDALHLSTCLLYRESLGQEVVLCSHDMALKRAARASGFEVLG